MSSAQTPDISLTDYVGISSMIDDIRGREQQISEIMNSSLVDKVLVERLSEQYKRNGLAVDEKVINLGIERYYQDRFKFKSYNLTGFNKFLSGVFMHRAAALMTTGVLAVASVSAPSINQAVVLYVDHERAVIAAEKQALQNGVNSDQMAELARIDKSANEWISKIERKIHSVELRQKHVRSLSAGETNLASLHDEVDAYVNSEIAFVRENLKKSKLAMEEIKKVGISQYSESIEKTDGIYKSFVADMDRLEKSRLMLSNLKGIAVEIEGLSSIKRRIESMNLSDRDKAVFDGYLNPLMDGINLISFNSINDTRIIDRKITNMNESATIIKDLVDYASNALIVYISNSGQSGYESNGKYFLNVYAYDLFNKPAGILHGFDSDASPKYNQGLSIQVSPELFNKIKQDKADDGYVDENVVGTKAANSLMVKYSDGILTPLVVH